MSGRGVAATKALQRFNAAQKEEYVLSNVIKLVEQHGFGVTRTGAVVATTKLTSVTFKVQPELSESKSVNYIEIGEIREPGSILIFIGSPARNFSMNIKLVSRSEEEAIANYNILHTLKSWTMPDSKYSSHDSLSAGNTDTGVPRVLKLFGYGSNIKGIPVVVKSLNVTYPVDCDYIGTGTMSMPVIMPIDIQLQEMRSANELETFNFDAYKTGTLPLW